MSLTIFFSTQGKSDTINLEQFINFLNEKQRDPRLNEILYPLYDEKRALEIINTYEQEEKARDASECSTTSVPITTSHENLPQKPLPRMV